jgi:hypothetical protein
MSATRPPTPDGIETHASRNGGTSDASSDAAQRIIVLGYITAIALPPVGLVLGLFIARRRQHASVRHGVWIILISFVAAAIWVLVLTSGVLTSTSTDTSY